MRAQDRLEAGLGSELGEKRTHVVSHGLDRHAHLLSDLRRRQPATQQLKTLVLARRQLGCASKLPRRRSRNHDSVTADHAEDADDLMPLLRGTELISTSWRSPSAW